jgi:hypothetical protein
LKRILMNLLASVLTFTVGTVASFVSHRNLCRREFKTKPILSLKFAPCPSGDIKVRNRPDSNAQLLLVQASCLGPTWKVVFKVQNTGGKAIKTLVVGLDETHEYKTEVEFCPSGKMTKGVGQMKTLGSSYGSLLEPGAVKTFNYTSGFREGSGDSESNGSIETSFRIVHIDYTDGTTWDDMVEQH